MVNVSIAYMRTLPGTMAERHDALCRIFSEIEALVEAHGGELHLDQISPSGQIVQAELPEGSVAELDTLLRERDMVIYDNELRDVALS